MKRCSCCKELKPESDFWADQGNFDNLNRYCKSCIRLYRRGFKVSEIRKLRQDEKSGWDKVGGLRINILNHVKKGEFQFNIAYVGKDLSFQTNNQTEFLRALQIHLGRAA